jgi:hypothetical protein
MGRWPQDEIDDYGDGIVVFYESDEQDPCRNESEEDDDVRRVPSDDATVPLEDLRKSDTDSPQVKSVRFDAGSFRDWSTRIVDDDDVVDIVEASPRRRRPNIMFLLGQSPVEDDRLQPSNAHYSIKKTPISSPRRHKVNFQTAAATILPPPLADPSCTPVFDPAHMRNFSACLDTIDTANQSETSMRLKASVTPSISDWDPFQQHTRKFGSADSCYPHTADVTHSQENTRSDKEPAQYRLRSKQSSAFFADDHQYNPHSYVSYYLRWAFRASFPSVIISAYVGFLALVIAFAFAIYGIGRWQPECFVMINGDHYGEVGKTFVDAFSLSWTTFSTCGYGAIYPRAGRDQEDPDSGRCIGVNMVSGSLEHSSKSRCPMLSQLTSEPSEQLMAWEAFVGVLFGSVVSAIFFGKVARTQSVAQIRWSLPICVRYGTGVKRIRHRASLANHLSFNHNQSDVTCPVHYPVNSNTVLNLMARRSEGSTNALVSRPDGDDSSSSNDTVLSVSGMGDVLAPQDSGRISASNCHPVFSSLELLKSAAWGGILGDNGNDGRSNAVWAAQDGNGKQCLQNVVVDAYRQRRRRKVWPCPILEFRIVNELANEAGGEIMDASVKAVATTLASAGSEGEVEQDVYHLLRSTSIINTRSVPQSTRKLVNLASTLSNTKQTEVEPISPAIPASADSRSTTETTRADDFDDCKSRRSRKQTNTDIKFFSHQPYPSMGTPQAESGMMSIRKASVGTETGDLARNELAHNSALASCEKNSDLQTKQDRGQISLLRRLNRHLTREKLIFEAKDRCSNFEPSHDSPLGNGEAALAIGEEDLERELQAEVERRLAAELHNMRAVIEESTKRDLATAAAKTNSIKMSGPVTVEEASAEDDYVSQLAPTRCYHRLEVEGDAHPLFKRLWTIRHVLDASSPLLSAAAKKMIWENHGSWSDECTNYDYIGKNLQFQEIIVSFSGTANASGNKVYSQKVYDHCDVNIGYSFANMFARPSDSSQRVVVDHDLLNDVFEQTGGGAAPFRLFGDKEGSALGEAAIAAATARVSQARKLTHTGIDYIGRKVDNILSYASVRC